MWYASCPPPPSFPLHQGGPTRKGYVFLGFRHCKRLLGILINKPEWYPTHSLYRGFTVTAYERITRGDMTYGPGFPGTKLCSVFSLHPRPTGLQCKWRLLLVSWINQAVQKCKVQHTLLTFLFVLWTMLFMLFRSWLSKYGSFVARTTLFSWLLKFNGI